MREKADTDSSVELTFDVKQGLRKALPFFPAPRSGPASDDSLDLIAETVVEHLKLCRWRLSRLPPVAPHSVGTREGDESSQPKAGK